MTDDELLAIANRVIDTEGECNVCDSLPIYRAIYAAGREELARECVDWWGGEADCYNVNQLKYFDDWLKQKGVM